MLRIISRCCTMRAMMLMAATPRLPTVNTKMQQREPNEQQVRLPSELAALPFPKSDVLLPGELKQCHLYEPQLIELFEHAMAMDGGLLAQTLEGTTSRAVPLLQVADSRPVAEGGIWCTLKCIGRVEVCEAAGLPWAASFGSVKIAGVWADHASPQSANHVGADALLRQVRELHSECTTLTSELEEAEGCVPVPKGAADTRYMWGHESYLPKFKESLGDTCHRRREGPSGRPPWRR